MKKKAFLFGILFICLFNTNRLSAQINNVYISEILYDSPFGELKTYPIHNNGEYIKLSNPTNRIIDISTWVLKGDEQYEQFAFPSGTTIPAQGMLLVAYKSGTNFDFAGYYHLGENVKIVFQSSIILCNMGESLALYDASLNLIDVVAYGDRVSSPYNPNMYVSNSDSYTYDQLLSLHRTQVSYANGKILPLSITDLEVNLATPSSSENALANNTTPSIPITPPIVDVNLIASQNYIITSVPKIAKTTSVLGADDELASVQYYDGLGRPTETVQAGITPLHADLVTLTEYDEFGREYKNWLPIISSNSGAYVDPTKFATNQDYNGDTRPFNEKHYEPSPMNRVDCKKGPGDAWLNKSATVNYQTNDANISYYYINNNNQLIKGSNYEVGALFVSQTTDEDSKTAYEFKNKLGKLILKRSVNDNSENIDTYYAYNDLGQLCYVIPPLASDILISFSGQLSMPDVITTQTTANEKALWQLAYHYRYDERGNCIYKHFPGCESIYMVYDLANRMVLSQDGNQRAKTPKQWTVTKYDAFGRTLYTGVINRDVAQTEKDLIHNNVITESIGTDNPLTNTGYTCNYFVNEVTPLTVNYYDNYSFISLLPNAVQTNLNYIADSEYDKAYPITAKAKEDLISTGLLTGIRTYQLDVSGDYTVAAHYYDNKGQIVQNRSTNHLGGYDIVYNTYNFTGQVIQTLKEHSTATTLTSPLTELYSYTYDHALRPLTTTYSLNGAASVILADMSADKSYDELGRLTKKMRHGTADTETFVYNIRNWTEEINSGNSFIENLYYNTNVPTGTKACYNGNIAYSTWTYNGQTKGYAYDYDKLNRLLSATFKQGTSNQSNDSYTENFTFDKMGNILTLKRKKDNVLIDDLVLNYCSNNQSNQLDWISDNGINQNQYNVKEYQNKSAATSNEFAYDANGNMTKDLDRDIITIRYNVLNLPELIQFKNGNQIINMYDAGGHKLQSGYYTQLITLAVPLSEGQVLNPDYTAGSYACSGTAYAGNAEYNISKLVEYKWGTTVITDQYSLSKLYNSEGYTTGSIIPDINNNRDGIQYNYFRKDHLGNNREVWQAPYYNYSGLQPASTVQRTQYYPSGLPWASSGLDNFSKQPLKYNGKEFVEMHGYDTYDYGARGYYPAGDFMPTVDPLAEKFYNISPYAYCGGNPVNRIDPSGMRLRDWDGNIDMEDDYYFSSDGEQTDHVKNKEPDRFFIQDDDGKIEHDDDSYTQIELNSELGYLSKIIYAEAGGENNISKEAVGDVMRNRVCLVLK